MKILKNIKCKLKMHNFVKLHKDQKLDGGYYKYKICDNCNVIDTKTGDFLEMVSDINKSLKKHKYSTEEIKNLWFKK